MYPNWFLILVVNVAYDLFFRGSTDEDGNTMDSDVNMEEDEQSKLIFNIIPLQMKFDR